MHELIVDFDTGRIYGGSIGPNLKEDMSVQHSEAATDEPDPVVPAPEEQKGSVELAVEWWNDHPEQNAFINDVMADCADGKIEAAPARAAIIDLYARWALTELRVGALDFALGAQDDAFRRLVDMTERLEAKATEHFVVQIKSDYLNGSTGVREISFYYPTDGDPNVFAYITIAPSSLVNHYIVSIHAPLQGGRADTLSGVDGNPLHVADMMNRFAIPAEHGPGITAGLRYILGRFTLNADEGISYMLAPTPIPPEASTP